MEMLMVWVVAVAGMAVGAVLSTIFFRLRAADIIDSAVSVGRSVLEVEVATQSSRARSAETDLLQARLEVQRMQEAADGWRRALESLSEERVRLSERANRVNALEADAARLALQTRLTEEEMRRLSASEAQKEQVIASLREEMHQHDAANSALQARLDTSLRLLHQSNERRAALEEQVTRIGSLEQQLRDANARHAQLHQHLLELRASTGRDSGHLAAQLGATREAAERLGQELAASRGVHAAAAEMPGGASGVLEALMREVAELRHWTRTVFDARLHELMARQQGHGTAESAAPPVSRAVRRHSPARPPVTVVAGRRRPRR